MDERIKTIADHYGVEHQLNKLKEEIEELREALSKKDESHILEETVDVCILLNQMLYLYNQDDFDDLIVTKAVPDVVKESIFIFTNSCFPTSLSLTEVDKVWDYKLNRTIQRMEKSE